MLVLYLANLGGLARDSYAISSNIRNIKDAREYKS